jgi:hypothetical protein
MDAIKSIMTSCNDLSRRRVNRRERLLRESLKEAGGLPQPPYNPFLAHRGEHVKKTRTGSLPGNSSPSSVDQNSRLYVQLGSQPTDCLLY